MRDNEFELMKERMLALEVRFEKAFRPGVVLSDSDIDTSDPEKPRARIHVGDDKDGNPVKSPWVPFASVAGLRNTHSAPSAGQQFLMISPDGEFESGLLIPHGHSKNIPAPSTDPKNFVDGTGATGIQFKDGKHQVKTGDKTLHLITSDGQRIQVESLDKLIIKVGDVPMKFSPDALIPASDIQDY